MREIKFRAWCPKQKIMFDIFTLEQAINENNTKWHEDEDIFMQFTGLKDCKGREIYEGDIVNVDEAGRCRVDYLDHSMKFYFQTLEGYKKQFVATSERVEIIGNVWENADLLTSPTDNK